MIMRGGGGPKTDDEYTLRCWTAARAAPRTECKGGANWAATRAADAQAADVDRANREFKCVQADDVDQTKEEKVTMPSSLGPFNFGLLLAALAGAVCAEPNGLARRPQQGWNSWNYEQAFCSDVSPALCLNETFMISVTDAVVSSGMLAAGYDIINLSEAWPATARAANGSLMADPVRFPHGVAWLADYIHARGLRFGIYLDVGESTCAGFPGSLGHEELDVATIVSWGADYLWLDGCNFAGNASGYASIYARWGQLLNNSGRAIVWEASYPAYLPGYTSDADLQYASSFSHEFRFFDDIRPDFAEIMLLVDYTIRNDIQRIARPGQYPLIDMLEVGNPGLSLAESRAHFSLWAMLAQPLHAGNDVSSMSAEVRDILTNPEVIAVDQDPLVRAGWRLNATMNATASAAGFVVVSGAAADCAFNHTAGGYFDTAIGGNIGQFGPNVTFADAKALCCSNDQCAGFSYSAATGTGFLKPDYNGMWTPSADYDGYDDLSRSGNWSSSTEVYARLLSDASVAVLLLNRAAAAAQVCVRWADVGLNGFAWATVRDLWRRADVGPALGGVCAQVASHDAVMLRVQQ